MFFFSSQVESLPKNYLIETADEPKTISYLQEPEIFVDNYVTMIITDEPSYITKIVPDSPYGVTTPKNTKTVLF